VKIGVLERDWHRVATGQLVRLTVSGLPDRVFETKVDKLGLLLDPQTHQSIAWAELPNEDKSPSLRPGMNGQAELSWRGAKPILAVPSQAVLSDGAERYVLVEEAATKEGSEYQKVAVVVGRQSAGHTEVGRASVAELETNWFAGADAALARAGEGVAAVTEAAGAAP
jgi:cobalt-zinc-cadmium efflux system membrane fusion protein